MRPEAKVEVAVEEELRKPPMARELVKVEEDWETRPVVKVPRPEMERVEEPVIGPEELREPETKREEPMVEEAEERKPPVNVPSPVMARVDCPVNAPPNVPVEEAVKVLAVLREPEVKRELENVEEAEEKRFVREESPETAREEEAERAPWTWRELLKVEDDWVTRPPKELM